MIDDPYFEGFLWSRIELAPGESKDCSGLDRPAVVEAFSDRVVLWCGADQIVLDTGDLKGGESRRLTFYPTKEKTASLTECIACSRPLPGPPENPSGIYWRPGPLGPFCADCIKRVGK